jgi:pyridinium-3,5-biscarboxylic acid mononucleotide synthase
MDPDSLRTVLEDVRAGRLDIDAGLARLRHLPFADIDFAKVDHHRALRAGFAEVVYCPGKTPEQVVAIVRELRSANPCVLATRAEADQRKALADAFGSDAKIHERARAVVVGAPKERKNACVIPIVTAGTSDLPVAEEALVTVQALGGRGKIMADVGVSGLHRLLSHAEELQKAVCIIVIAGMEGALASAVGGLVACPVIAVPTSVGYGANFSGVTPLLAMLSSCASNVACVNIDAGFKAGYVASCIDRTRDISNL